MVSLIMFMLNISCVNSTPLQSNLSTCLELIESVAAHCTLTIINNICGGEKQTTLNWVSIFVLTPRTFSLMLGCICSLLFIDISLKKRKSSARFSFTDAGV